MIAVVSTALVSASAFADDNSSGIDDSPQEASRALNTHKEALDLEFASTGVPDLEGRWLKQVIIVAESSAGPVGTIEVRTSTFQLVDVKQKGREVVLNIETCSAQMSDDSSMISTTFTERLASSMAERRRTGRLYRRDGDWFLGIDRDWELLGMTMESPETEELPQDGEDPRVLDQDGDGNPGFTIEVRGLIDGEVYVARRGWDQFMGRLNGEGQIRGRVTWESEEKVLGASRRMLRSSPDSVPNEDASRFRMQRVSSEVDCEAVDHIREGIFEE